MAYASHLAARLGPRAGVVWTNPPTSEEEAGSSLSCEVFVAALQQATQRTIQATQGRTVSMRTPSRSFTVSGLPSVTFVSAGSSTGAASATPPPLRVLTSLSSLDEVQLNERLRSTLSREETDSSEPSADLVRRIVSRKTVPWLDAYRKELFDATVSPSLTQNVTPPIALVCVVTRRAPPPEGSEEAELRAVADRLRAASRAPMPSEYPSDTPRLLLICSLKSKATEAGVTADWIRKLSVLTSGLTLFHVTMDDVSKTIVVLDEVHDVLLRGILGFNEKRIFNLHAFCASHRKGLRTALKSFVWGASSSTNPQPNGAVSSSTLRAEMSKLGYLLMAVKDYESALVSFTHLRDELADGVQNSSSGALGDPKTLLRLIGETNETMVYCSLLTGSSPSKALEAAERAVDAYVRGSVPAPHVARAALSLAHWEWLLAPELAFASSAHRLLTRVADASDVLTSAVLLECAGVCWLNGSAMSRTGLAPRPDNLCVRKYALSMVMAGSLYKSSRLPRHALRCFEAVYPGVLDRSGWDAAEQFCRVQLGSLHASLGNHREAGDHRLAALARPLASSPATQANWLKDLSEALASSAPSGVFPSPSSVPLLMNPTTARLETESHLVQGEEEEEEDEFLEGEREEEEEEVEAKERALARLGRAASARTGRAPALKRRRVARAGETLRVVLVFHNPLSLPLTLYDLRLDVWYATGDGEVEGRAEPVEELALEAKETKRVALRLRTPTETEATAVSVRGLKWRLVKDASSLCLSREFPLRGKRLLGTREQRVTGARAPDTRLTLEVGPASPFLTWSVREEAPAELSAFATRLEGSASRFALRATNRGSVRLESPVLYLTNLHGPSGRFWVESNGVISRAVPRTGGFVHVVTNLPALAPDEAAELVVEYRAHPACEPRPGRGLSLIALYHDATLARLSLPTRSTPITPLLMRPTVRPTESWTRSLLRLAAHESTKHAPSFVPLRIVVVAEAVRAVAALPPLAEWAPGDASMVVALEHLENVPEHSSVLPEEEDENSSSFPANVVVSCVSLTRSTATLLSSPPERDARLRAMVWSAEEARRAAKRRELREAEAKRRAELVSIQDIRRANQEAAALASSSDAASGTPPPLSLGESFESFAHVLVEWSVAGGERLGWSFLPFVPARPRPVRLRATARAVGGGAEAERLVELSVRVRNVSRATRVMDAVLALGSEGNSTSAFPLPSYWLGVRARPLGELGPGEEREVATLCGFAAPGVYACGPVALRYCTESDGKREEHVVTCPQHPVVSVSTREIAVPPASPRAEEPPTRLASSTDLLSGMSSVLEEEEEEGEVRPRIDVEDDDAFVRSLEADLGLSAS